MNPEPRMITIAQLAKRWGVSRSGAWNYIKRGQLPKGKRDGRTYFYPADTAKPEPRTRVKRGRHSKAHPAQARFDYIYTWPAPERAP